MRNFKRSEPRVSRASARSTFRRPEPIAFDADGPVFEAPIVEVDWLPVQPDAPVAPDRLLPGNSEDRKAFPIATGVVDYFPDALAAVAEISYKGNKKHNPGEPLHWARGKSMDHADCIMRHFVERGNDDAQGNSHSAQMAWRALALLQQELEEKKALSLPRGATQG